MELTKIKYFLEIADTQHVTQSAKNLHVSQPALTKAIRDFEAELGAPLFARKGRNIILTRYGVYLRDHLQPVVQELHAIPDRLKAAIKLESEVIHVNVRAAWTLVTDAIISYKTQHPAAKFKIVQSYDNDLSDICITTNKYYTWATDKLAAEFERPEKIYLAVPNNDVYKCMTSIKLDMVRDEDFISLLGSTQFRHICDEFCQALDFKPHFATESDSPTAVKNMIAANIELYYGVMML